MRILSKLFRMFSSGGRATTGRRGAGYSRGTATRGGGGLGSILRRVLR